MLFDLQGRRKVFIKVVYLGLAVLMAGGLVLFGVGSDVNGGLSELFTGPGGGDVDQYTKNVERAQAKVKANPKSAPAYGKLIRERYNLAGAGDNFKNGEFTPQGKAILKQIAADWAKYSTLTEKPDRSVTSYAISSFETLEDYKGAMRAQQQLAALDDPPESASYLAVFQYALLAKDNRTAEFAGARALELAPKKRREDVKKQIQEIRTSVIRSETPE